MILLVLIFSFLFLLNCGNGEKHKDIRQEGSEYEVIEELFYEDKYLFFEDIEKDFYYDGEIKKFFGSPCKIDDDCESKICLAGKGGEKVCSQFCFEECPSLWTCESVFTKAGNIAFVCFPDIWDLCMECNDNTMCGGDDDYCISVGETGFYCGMNCLKDEDCPEHYLCQETKTIDEKLLFQCIPDTQSCVCNYENIGKKRPCFVENEFGKCYGEEICKGKEGWTDCNAKTPSKEKCNGIDDDCNGKIDEEILSVHCTNENKYGSCEGMSICKGEEGIVCVAPSPEGEYCDGKDNNCDGDIDEEGSTGCYYFYRDKDKDLYGDPSAKKCLCSKNEEYSTLVGGDCDDNNPAVHPIAIESCNNADDNCDGNIDEKNAVGCEIYYFDEDSDGFGISEKFLCLCKSEGKFSTKNIGDCNDKLSEIFPVAEEICNGIDDNCNNEIDEDCDVDKDGYCGINKKVSGKPPSCPKGGGDCNDKNVSINPEGNEVCDGIDNNCNNEIDEGVNSPCGSCLPICVLQAGAGTSTPFKLIENSYDGVTINESGYVKLKGDKNNGFYRHIFKGWDKGETLWHYLSAVAQFPSGTSFKIRVRTSLIKENLPNENWGNYFGPFPQNEFPINLSAENDLKGNFLEVEIFFETSSLPHSPVLKKIEIVSHIP